MQGNASSLSGGAAHGQTRSVHRGRGTCLLPRWEWQGGGDTSLGILLTLLHLIFIALMEIRQLKQSFLLRGLTLNRISSIFSKIPNNLKNTSILKSDQINDNFFRHSLKIYIPNIPLKYLHNTIYITIPTFFIFFKITQHFNILCQTFQNSSQSFTGFSKFSQNCF